MGKKIQFKKFQLPRREKPEPYTVTMDGPEGVTAAERGYFPGSTYTREEWEFVQAVEAFKKRHKSKFLASIGYLRVAQELGYQRHPTPPTQNTPVNANQILRQMVEVGFQFIRGSDNTVSFVPPPDVDGNPEKERLFAVLAWSWNWLSEHAAKYVTPTESTQ